MAQTRLLRLREVECIVGLKKTSIYRLMAKAEFPQPVRVSSAAVRWDSDDISAWIESRRAARAA